MRGSQGCRMILLYRRIRRRRVWLVIVLLLLWREVEGLVRWAVERGGID